MGKLRAWNLLPNGDRETPTWRGYLPCIGRGLFCPKKSLPSDDFPGLITLWLPK
jgi:hypothetical protein